MLTNGGGINAVTIAEYVVMGMLTVAKGYRTAASTDAAVWPNRTARSSGVRMPPAFGLTSLALA